MSDGSTPAKRNHSLMRAAHTFGRSEARPLRPSFVATVDSLAFARPMWAIPENLLAFLSSSSSAGACNWFGGKVAEEAPKLWLGGAQAPYWCI